MSGGWFESSSPGMEFIWYEIVSKHFELHAVKSTQYEVCWLLRRLHRTCCFEPKSSWRIA